MQCHNDKPRCNIAVVLKNTLPHDVQLSVFIVYIPVKVCQGIHQMFLSKALYVLVFNLVNSDSCQQLPKYMSYVQAKVSV